MFILTQRQKKTPLFGEEKGRLGLHTNTTYKRVF
jgi:hypothetical protein